jgi:hypothetical protein
VLELCCGKLEGRSDHLELGGLTQAFVNPYPFGDGRPQLLEGASEKDLRRKKVGTGAVNHQ